MSLFPALSVAEFASLSIAGRGPFPVPTTAIKHWEKLEELKFIAAVDGGYTMTSAGRFRIAVGK
jgi:hypothetical protein